MLGDDVIRWTARLFVACYVARLCVDATGRRDEAARWLWTAGCGVFWWHVAAAFHYQHGWSHAAAFEHVRLRTLHDTGWNSGIGLYVNYAFGALWLMDSILWWRQLDWPDHRQQYWLVQAAFAFLMIQATAVFGPPLWTPICAAVVMSLMAIRLWHRRHAP